MEGEPKRPRGRPRKYPQDLIFDVKRRSEILTDRGAQNSLNYSSALVEICDHCTVETQRYFLGGITGEEIHAGVLPKCKIKRYVMQELGRHPKEEIVEIAEAIAGNRKIDAWTQKEIVDLLKDIRIGRDQK
jgi:hypothetical protein